MGNWLIHLQYTHRFINRFSISWSRFSIKLALLLCLSKKKAQNEKKKSTVRTQALNNNYICITSDTLRYQL